MRRGKEKIGESRMKRERQRENLNGRKKKCGEKKKGGERYDDQTKEGDLVRVRYDDQTKEGDLVRVRYEWEIVGEREVRSREKAQEKV